MYINTFLQNKKTFLFEGYYTSIRCWIFEHRLYIIIKTSHVLQTKYPISGTDGLFESLIKLMFPTVQVKKNMAMAGFLFEMCNFPSQVRTAHNYWPLQQPKYATTPVRCALLTTETESTIWILFGLCICAHIGMRACQQQWYAPILTDHQKIKIWRKICPINAD